MIGQQAAQKQIQKKKDQGKEGGNKQQGEQALCVEEGSEEVGMRAGQRAPSRNTQLCTDVI